MTKEKRSAIISLHKRGFRPLDISRLLAVPKQTVYYAINRFDETGDLKDRPRIGRPITACTSWNREIVRKRIDQKSMRSMESMAKSIGINEKSVRKIVRDHLGYYSCKIAKAHHLDDRMKANRLLKAQRMKRLAAAGRNRLILFTDEKIFMVEQAHNHQNDRQLLPAGQRTSQNLIFIT